MTYPAQSLLLEHLNPNRTDRILILEGGDGWLAGEAARLVPDGEVLTLCRDVREAWAAQTRLKAVPNADANLDVYPTTSHWDIVLLPIPKERRFTRTLLLSAWKNLASNGLLLLAGPTRKGAKAVIKDAECLFDNATLLGFRSHQRVAACYRSEEIPDPLPQEFQQPGIAPNTTHTVEICHTGGELSLETHPGIFSWKEVDSGTSFLLDHLVVEAGSKVWDVGCGYGVIGLSASKMGAESVTMSDVNLIAIDYAKKNAVINQEDQITDIFPADGLNLPTASPSFLYDLIVSNPAFHQGHQVDQSMADKLISQASENLKPKGRLVVVANRFLNYDRFMREHFSKVMRTAENTKFHLIEAMN